MKVVALDAGGATLKASVVAPGVDPTVSILANYVASTSANPTAVFMGQKLRELERQRAKLRYLRPVQRGYCVNWNVESELWTHLFTSTEMLKVDPSEHALVVTAPLLAPTVVNESMDQVVFEELGFQAYARVSAAESCVLSYSEFSEREFQESLKKPVKRSPGRKKREKGKTDPPTPPPVVDEDPLRFSTSSCHLVVDSGFSFTHVVPVIDRKVYLPGVRRINVGGKLLTNYLKEIVSYRQWNVMDDTPVINELKEALCYCSLDFDNDLKRYHSDRQERKHWILPDFVRRFEGRCREDEEEVVTEEEEEEEEAAEEEASADQQQPTRPTDDEQALEMGVEMITVPEVLFNPSDIGLNQAGIAETIVQAVEACPEELSDAFYANILLVGGNTKFKNFKRRLERDLRSLVPDDYDIELNEPSDPILAAWRGCCSLVESDALSGRVVTKQEYEEHGSNICLKRF
ncbi:actin-like protein [Phytophthora cinnamomi]|uniref:actin-like protein n=1 Tax=Phytophthora cinnamomi TaxID=4785 RepID=UPI003559BC03|nr:actin-like protein [Phytophthora cinnamomi]